MQILREIVKKKLDCQGRLVLTVFIMKRNKEKNHN